MKTYIQIVLVFSIFISCSKDVEPEVIPNYNLKVSVTPVEGGTVTPSEGSYPNGTAVSLLATPSPEYVFKEWTGGVTGTTNPVSVTMTSNKNISVVFEKRKYPLSIIIEGEGTVTEELLQSKPTTDYPSGSVVKLTAVPVDGWEFESWSGDYVGTENPINITVDKSKSITIKFRKKQESFVSKSPTYFYPNNTVGQIINSQYFPGKMINTLDFREKYLLDTKYSTWVRDKVYIDFNKDGFLDYFGFLINMEPNWGLDYGKFILIDNFFGNNPITKFIDTNINFFSGMELNQLNNDDDMEIIVHLSNAHESSPENTVYELPVKIIKIDTNGNLTEKNLDSEPMGAHDMASGDVDNDGDVDILIWRTDELKSMPILYFNDGNGNFERSDSYIQFSGLQNIFENHNYGPYFVIWAVEFFDLNNDGNLDIIGGQFLNNDDTITTQYIIPNIRIYWGNGTGKFDLLNNFTDLKNTSITGLANNRVVLGFTFFDYDNDGDYDVVSSVTNSYSGYYIQLYEQTSRGVFKDVTTSVFDKWFDLFSPTGSEGKMANFYNPRIYDKNGDGLYDILPDDIATFGGWVTPLNSYWENMGGYFIRKEYHN